MRFNNPLYSLSFYGIQRLLIERYPETVKYQRTCMQGFPNCGKCFECNALAMHFRSMGYSPRDLSYPTDGEEAINFNLSNMFRDVVVNAYKKLKGQKYANWLDASNLYAMNFNWEKDKVNKIIQEHFNIYSNDPGEDGMGTCNYPSLWEDWINTEKSELFWKAQLKNNK